MFIQKKKSIKANSEVEVATEATELLFEASDVAELVAEVTGEDVEVSVEGDEVTFVVGEDEFTVAPEGDEEVLEAVKVKTDPVKASTNKRVIRKVTAKK